MKLTQIIKKVNNTEIGAATTHETYVLVTQNLIVEDVFEELEKQYPFVCKQNGKTYLIRLTSGRERRIVGLGPFYSDVKIEAGDEVLFEKIEKNGSDPEYYISVKKFDDNIVLIKKKIGFEVLTPNRLKLLTPNSYIVQDGIRKPFKIVFKESKKKRADSPDKTNFYSAQIGDSDIGSEYKNNDLLELVINDDDVRIRRFQPWERYVFVMEGKNE